MGARKKLSPLVLMDTREPENIRLAFRSVLGETVEYVALPEGDFAIPDKDNCLLGIERKTVGDLINSLRDGRLVSQLRRMETAYTYRVLLIEGELRITGEGFVEADGYETRWSHASVQMALWSLQQHITGLVVLWTVNLGGTIDAVRAFSERASRKPCVRETTLVAPVGQSQSRESPSASKSGCPRQTSSASLASVPGMPRGRSGQSPQSHGPGDHVGLPRWPS